MHTDIFLHLNAKRKQHMKRLPLIFLFLILCTSTSIVWYIYSHETAGRHEQEERSGALGALNYWTAMRAYPNSDIPSTAYYRAYQLATAKRKEYERTISSTNIWEPIGPTNLHGRCISVAINPQNPNTVYLGTASGGLWRSYTGGLGGDWLQVPLGYPALGISAIVIDPTDTNTIYIGTGEVYQYQAALGGLVVRTTRGSYGIGILKSTNAGASWSKSLDWSYNQERGIEKIEMNPLNHNTLYAATTEGIYKTVNSGGVWTNIYTSAMGEDIVINSSDTNNILASFGNFALNPHIMKSTDAGTDWTPTPAPSFSGKALMCAYRTNPNIVYASIADSTTGVGGLWKSTDFGDSWNEVIDRTSDGLFGTPGSGQGWYSHFVIVHPTDSSQIIQNSVNVSKSTDGGVTFFGVGTGYSDNHGYAFHPTNPNIVYVVNDDGIYRSTDFGSSYVSVGSGLQTGQFYNGFSCSATDSLMAIGQSQDHIPGYRYLGSAIWDHGTVSDESGWTATDQTNDNVQYCVDRYGTDFLRSNNRGASFSYLYTFGGYGSWNSPFVVSTSNPSVLYFADTKIYKSTNSGSNWTVTSSSPLDANNTALSMAIARTSPDTVIVGMAPLYSQARLYCTTNGGSSWTDVTGTTPDRYPVDLAIDPNNSKTMYAAFGGFGSGHLFKTTNTGSSWTDMTGTLPDVPTDAIAIDPLNSNYVYVGNDLGVYLSTDAGSTWTPFSSGLPDAVIVADLVISPSNRSLRVATHGNGVYERKLYNGTALPTFDYAAVTLNFPADGSMIPQDSVLSGIKATFQNAGTQAQTDSFYVKYRILQNNTEVFSSLKKTGGLGLNVSKIVTFDDAFTPPDTGTFALQAISLAGDQDPTNDTVKGTLIIVAPSMVANWKITKGYCPYTEIAIGSPGPVGDDVELRASIPFSFTYDGFGYDSVQISTNGWMELGTGTSGTLHGLSTASQVGGYFSPVLSTTDHPTKVLGPWFADLATGSTGVISYTTLGTAPNRVFVVQWKNMPAYYDESNTSTKLNFQIQLDEGSNIVEYHYGPLVSGTYSGTGAAIGLKDYIGGDFRYYDISRMASGLANQLVMTLSPLVNWPGQDSCYHITTNIFGVTVSISANWNIISDPVVTFNHWYKSFFPSAGSRAFEYHAGYHIVDSLVAGKGYWIKFPSSVSQTIFGDSMATVTATVDSGWNIIGSVDHTISAPTGGMVISKTFAYNGSYQIVSTLTPGKGYWVKTNMSGSLPLGPRALPQVTTDPLDSYTEVTIADQSGRKQKLYLAPGTDSHINPDFYAMPPVPPADAFDIRFVSQRMLEVIPQNIQDAAVFPVQMQSVAYPVTVTYAIKNSNGKQIILDEQQPGTQQHHILRGEGSLTISAGNENTLSMRVTNGKEIPLSFALKQNFPNPFNPTTKIAFDVPVASRVTIKVYDIIGREVMTPANGFFEAGSYTVSADFNVLASGIYFYRLTAGNFTDVKKMVVTK